MDKTAFTDEKRNALEELPLALSVFRLSDGNAEPVLVSDGFCKLFGRESREETLSELKENPALCKPEDAEKTVGPMMRFLNEGESFETMYRANREGGGLDRMVHTRGERVTLENGEDLFYFWYMEGPPAGAAPMFPSAPPTGAPTVNLDLLIGLPDKSVFFPSVIRRSREMIQSGTNAAFLFFDLNGMKYYNNRYSFEQGNLLLKTFGDLLAKTFGTENCCHLGGDHYTAFAKAEGLDDVLNTFFKEAKKLNDSKSLPVHVGIYVDYNANFPVTVAIDRAKYACDSLRNTYDSVFSYYNETLNDDLEHRQYILSHLDQAIKEGWIQVYYQPIVRAVSAEICDEEALARWDDPEKGLLSPAQFIPILEDARIIYKMDLYVLEEILIKIKRQKEAGIYLVPQSLNVSRSDFDSCDMVEEVRRRVDAAGIPRHLITIEVTESMVGSNQEFMKKQIERFQELGFPVWMDDFGSGYSSIDVMQSIRFDLIKFDMNFMKRMSEGGSGKTILSELMHMAIAMNVDTVCEGVETKEQVIFLREIGCSKLQGYYFSEPLPFETILEHAENDNRLRFENPEETSYYETMGRINLYDLSVVAVEDESLVRNYWDVLPMAVLEMKGEAARYTRSNPSYRYFAKRFFDFDLADIETLYNVAPEGLGREFMRMVKQSCSVGKWAFVDETMSDGSNVHAFIRKIADNPVTDEYAVLIIVLSVQDSSVDNTYESVARALAPDYYNTYYVNLETDDYVKYSATHGRGGVALERRGHDFFGTAKRGAESFVHEEDRESFLAHFTKEEILDVLNQGKEYMIQYRLTDTGTPVPVELRAVRLHSGEQHLIIEVRLLENPE